MVRQYEVIKVIHILMLFICGLVAFFLVFGRYTPNAAVMGDMDWNPIYHTHNGKL